MQLFITQSFSIKENNIIIEDQRIIYQLSKVLRARKGYSFCIQSEGMRYNTELINIEKNKLSANLLGKEKINTSGNNISMIISLTNNHKKIELIVQKLSEIGINNIYFWQTERSILKEISKKKIERLNLISLEATEQSRGNYLTKIKIFKKDEFKKFLNKNSKKSDLFIFFDKKENNYIRITPKNKNEVDIYGIVGPEGGLTENDYKIFEKSINSKNIIIKSLGNTILRTETASIIGGRLLKNHFKSSSKS